MARRFDGTANGWAVVALAGFTDGTYGTTAALVYLSTYTQNGPVMFLGSSDFVDVVDTLNVYGGTTPFGAGRWNATAGVDCIGPDALTTGKWLLVVTSKATGTVAVREHVYTFNTGTWTHSNSSATSADYSGAAPVSATIGGINSSTFTITGDIGCVAMWSKRVLTDSEIERLPQGRWDLMEPAFLVEYPSGVDFPAQTQCDFGRGRGRQSSVGSGVTRTPQTDPPGFRFSPANRRR